jgi:NADH-quinone oxidoreductase subunit D
MTPPAVPIRQDFLLNMGPQHPSTHGVLKIILHIEGERVIRSETVLGYAHRGVEKMAENRSYLQLMPLMDRLDYPSALLFEWGYVGALERALGIQPAERSEYIRVIMAELCRISSHLLWAGAFLLDLGAFTPFLWLFDARERILDMFEEVTGQRMTSNYFHVGGVRDDLTDGFRRMLDDFLAMISERMRDSRELIESIVFLVRARGVGVITKADVTDYGLTGPVARGSGVPYDVRKVEPYSVYGKLDFSVPTGPDGDCLSRYKVRLEEIAQSVRIVEQAAAMLPGGPHREKAPKIIKLPEGECYFAVESGRGLFGVYIAADGSDKPSRFKLRVPSFSNLSVFDKLTVGQNISDVVAILGSIDIVVPEIDR